MRATKGFFAILVASILTYLIFTNNALFSNRNLKYSGCLIEWKYPGVSIEFYEQSSKKKEIPLTKPMHVSSIYPDPTIRLNPEKFILPIVYNGPNNQLVGLREAVFVAIKLNRTVVIPRFLKHFSDSSATSHKNYIYPGHRLSIEDFCKFISCVTIEQFQRACGQKIDAIFHIGNYVQRDITDWEAYTGMKIKEAESKINNNNNQPNIKLIPDDPLPIGQRHRKFRAEGIVNLMSSEDPCVLYPRPLYNLHVHAMVAEKNNFNVELLQTQADLEWIPNSRLFLSICNASGSPNYIKKIAKNFVRTHIKNQPFVGVHWRYNKDDFMKRCRGTASNNLKEQLCDNAMRIKPEHIANSIENKIMEMQNFASITKVTNIYIASPTSEREVIEEVSILLYQKYGWFTYSSLDLESLLNKEYSQCEFINRHFDDIISTTEMEICVLATSFLGSARSSWSGNVHLSRKAMPPKGTIPQLDGDIFKMSAELLDERDA